MFCPLCKAEYRQGFTRCADCDVELVPSLPAAPAPPAEPPPLHGDLVLLWRGRELAFFSQLVHALHEVGIACHGRTRVLHSPEECFEVPLVGNEYEVQVLERDLPAARQMMDEQSRLFAGAVETVTGAGDVEAALQFPPEDDGISNEDILEWEAQGTGVEAWAGEDSAQARFIRDALRENNIGYRTASAQTGSEQILVRVDDLPRAREIIREVFEGIPPKEAS